LQSSSQSRRINIHIVVGKLGSSEAVGIKDSAYLPTEFPGCSKHIVFSFFQSK
jgi:hypothetical protein